MLTSIRSHALRLTCGETQGGLVLPGDAQRAQVEAFVADIYRRHHGACLRSFLPDLLAFRDGDDCVQAVVGLRRGGAEPLFVEQYLDAPAEAVVAAHAGRQVDRRLVVEVGNLAVSTAGDIRPLVAHLTALLHEAGLRWVLFTATRQLRNTFARIGLAPVELADARADRLRDDASDWGNYYAVQPRVVLGDLAAGQAWLHARTGACRDPDAPSLELLARSA
jgi:hypothetical protein